MKHMDPITWTTDEWTAVAKRASQLRQNNGTTPWITAVLVSQDEIAPERRRLNFNKLSTLKPMFDLLGLDADGNVIPPPPPPVQEPEPPAAPPPALPAAPVKAAEPVTATTPLGRISTVDLVTEIFGRAGQIKAMLEQVILWENKLATRSVEIEQKLSTRNEEVEQKLAQGLARVGEVEAMMLNSMDSIDQALRRISNSEQLTAKVAKQAELIRVVLEQSRPSSMQKAALAVAAEEAPAAMVEMTEAAANETRYRVAPLRFLLFGPFDKDIAHIKQKLPRTVNAIIVRGQNDSNYVLPSRVDYCLVSGHKDFGRRWIQCREVYGDEKVRKLDNGSDSTFAHTIEQICILHSQEDVAA